jgi:hypothetical protein
MPPPARLRSCPRFPRPPAPPGGKQPPGSPGRRQPPSHPQAASRGRPTARTLTPPHAARRTPPQERHDAGADGLAGAPGDSAAVSKWRQKEKLKTTAVALVLCLNIGARRALGAARGLVGLWLRCAGLLGRQSTWAAPGAVARCAPGRRRTRPAQLTPTSCGPATRTIGPAAASAAAAAHPSSPHPLLLLLLLLPPQAWTLPT